MIVATIAGDELLTVLSGFPASPMKDFLLCILLQLFTAPFQILDYTQKWVSLVLARHCLVSAQHHYILLFIIRTISRATMARINDSARAGRARRTHRGKLLVGIKSDMALADIPQTRRFKGSRLPDLSKNA